MVNWAAGIYNTLKEAEAAIEAIADSKEIHTTAFKEGAYQKVLVAQGSPYPSVTDIWNKDISAYTGVGYAGTYLKTLYEDWLNGGRLDLLVDGIKVETDQLPNVQHETEWSSTPAVDQVANAVAASLTAGSIAVTYPTGATRVRAILVASIHAANQTANTHHINLKVQGQKDAGGYGDLLDLTAQGTLGLVNFDGAADGWCGTIDVTALVDTSGSTYTFKFIVDSDDANAIDYTSGFTLVLVYTM